MSPVKVAGFDVPDEEFAEPSNPTLAELQAAVDSRLPRGDDGRFVVRDDVVVDEASAEVDEPEPVESYDFEDYEPVSLVEYDDSDVEDPEESV